MAKNQVTVPFVYRTYLRHKEQRHVPHYCDWNYLDILQIKIYTLMANLSNACALYLHTKLTQIEKEEILSYSQILIKFSFIVLTTRDASKQLLSVFVWLH